MRLSHHQCKDDDEKMFNYGRKKTQIGKNQSDQGRIS